MPWPECLPAPRHLADLTPDLLTAILGQGTVTGVRIEPLTAQASYNAQLARLYLTYASPSVDAPRSIVAKVPSEGPDPHDCVAVFQPGAKEHWFYGRAAARTPVHVPHCYYSAEDPVSGESFLLLEDLAPAQTGNWLAGATPLQIDLALQAAARLHAAWWQVAPEDVPGLAHLVQNVTDEQDLVEQLYAEAWPRFVDHASFEIPADVRYFGERLQGRMAETEALLKDSPRTLAHGDFRVDNMLFGERGGQSTCWIIDWEDVLLWNGTFDVAWLLGGCLRVQDRDQEQMLLRRYYQALTDEGVERYAWKQCAHDYRCAMLSCFVQGILSAVPPETDDAYTHSLARTIGERFATVPSRLALDELMPA